MASSWGSAKFNLIILFYRSGSCDISQELARHIVSFIVRSVADPGCLSQLRTFSSAIPDPGSKRSGIPDPGSKRSRIRIRIKEFKYFESKTFLLKLSEIWSGMIIPAPDFFPIPDPGVKKHRILDSERIRNTTLSVSNFIFNSQCRPCSGCWLRLAHRRTTNSYRTSCESSFC